GRPVVATSVGGLPDAIEPDVSGLLVAAGDRAALREAIERLLADAPLRQRLGAAARELARERFSPAAQARGLIEVYRGA
ncbi:MAG TPA: glycosyltransferase, partial [Gaiellaceae bacterium]